MKFILTNLIFLFYLFPLYSNMFTVRGIVVDYNTGLPIQYACVFIANTTVGIISNDKGEFQLSFSNVGISNLVVTHVSYQTFITNITENEDSLYILIKLKPKIYGIEAVNIYKKDPNRKNKIRVFSEGLLGQSNNALSCRILNPSVLNLKGKKILSWNLEVRADSMLIISNKNLGYRIKFDLVYFEKSFNSIIYFGYPFFEDCIDEVRNPERILSNRKNTYEGSKLHFFRSLYFHSLQEEGYEIYRLIPCQKDNIDQRNFSLLEDSIVTGDAKIKLKQSNQQFNLYEYLTLDSISGTKNLTIDEPFEIRYTGRGEENRYKGLHYYYEGLNRIPKAQVSIVKLKNGHIRFYSNGAIEKSDELISIGYWSFKRLADLLPNNYSVSKYNKIP